MYMLGRPSLNGIFFEIRVLAPRRGKAVARSQSVTPKLALSNIHLTISQYGHYGSRHSEESQECAVVATFRPAADRLSVLRGLAHSHARTP
jgi:hypothetical protein